VLAEDGASCPVYLIEGLVSCDCYCRSIAGVVRLTQHACNYVRDINVRYVLVLVVAIGPTVWRATNSYSTPDPTRILVELLVKHVPVLVE
jgi:hypothetical protein